MVPNQLIETSSPFILLNFIPANVICVLAGQTGGDFLVASLFFSSPPFDWFYFTWRLSWRVLNVFFANPDRTCSSSLKKLLLLSTGGSHLACHRLWQFNSYIHCCWWALWWWTLHEAIPDTVSTSWESQHSGSCRWAGRELPWATGFCCGLHGLSSGRYIHAYVWWSKQLCQQCHGTPPLLWVSHHNTTW